MNRTNQTLVIFLCTLIILVKLTHAQDLIVREGRIKSACIYHITQFVEWPRLESEAYSKFKVCTAGDDPLNRYLEDTLKNKKKKNLSFEVMSFERIPSKTALQTCKLLFIGEIKPTESDFYFSNIIPKETLLIDSKANEHPNSLIAIYKTDNKIGINIKLESAEKLGYKISSELLQIAIIH